MSAHSQNKFRWDVIDEMDTIQSIEELNDIRTKYIGLLVFNDNKEDNDATPYIPSSSYSADLVCNKYGNVMINGEVRNLNDVTSYSEIEKKSMMKTSNHQLLEGTGCVENADKDRKYWCEAWFNLRTGCFDIRLVAHKQTWFGYMAYRTVYALNVSSYIGWTTIPSFWKPYVGNFRNTKELPSGDFYPIATGYGAGYNWATLTVYARTRGVNITRSFTLNVHK